MSAEGVFSASLSCGSALGPAVDSLLRSEDPQFFRVDATAVSALRSFDAALAGLVASSGPLKSTDDGVETDVKAKQKKSRDEWDPSAIDGSPACSITSRQ